MWFRNPKKVEYHDVFTGPRKKHGLKSCPGSCPSLKKGMLEVGKLVVGAKEGGLVCEVPKKGCKECNKESDEFCFKHTEDVDIGRSGLIKSKKRPIVLANEDGTMVLVVSSDKVTDEYPIDTPKSDMLNRRRNLAKEPDKSLKKANDLYQAFHGVPGNKILKVNIEEPSYLAFFGWLNHIIYDVPNRSARRGVPFIHEAKDRGDDTPPAREKPYVCVSPKFDYLVMFGSQFSFTERGIIG